MEAAADEWNTTLPQAMASKITTELKPLWASQEYYVLHDSCAELCDIVQMLLLISHAPVYNEREKKE